jgi:hypothetical protein
MGNEPCSETPWIYSFLGKPYRTSSIVRQIITQLYSTGINGLPGNDDLGQMSSWYVFAALGMYPEIPGDNVLILNGPLFPQEVVHLTNGDVTITGNGAGDNAPYVQSLTVNGQASSASWIRFTNIANGGTLAFIMGTTANTNWGANPTLSPPSYMDGMTVPVAQNYFWGTGLETNEIQISWTNTVDTAAPGGGITNVGPIISGVSGPELGIRNENSQSGNYEIMYSGYAQGGASDYAYMEAFSLSNQNVTISPGMHFSYWIFPQSQTNSGLVTGSNSLYVAPDLIFIDGTDLWDSGLTNQYGGGVNPASQASSLALDTWNYVTVDLTPLTGKTINRIDLGYSKPASTGGYRGYVDDIALTTPASLLPTNNLALNQPASADSQAAGYPASCGNDGNVATRWSANDGNTNHWWQVDLGAICSLTGDEVIWQFNGVVYDYTVAVSRDNTNWTEVVNQTANTSPAQDQANVFIATGRYVRITVTGLPAGDWASFDEFRVFGAVITQLVLGSYEATVVANNPVAYWLLNETSGSVAFDLMGGNNGTYVGDVTIGQPGVPLAGFGSPSYTALFDGTSGYVDIPEGPFNITGAITTVAWVNVPVTPHFSGIIGHGDSSWRMSVNGSGYPGGNDGSSSGDATSPTSIVGSGWHMVAYAYTGVPNVANNGSFYLDGALTANDTISSVAGNGLDVWIGGAPDYGTGRLLPGSIAQVAVFTNALSAAGVQTLYNAATNALPITLTFVPSGPGNTINLVWTGGTLLQATNIAGPWTTNTAASPYTIMPTNAQMYFRVRVE